MKNNGIIVDTCIWIEYFNSKASKYKQLLEKLLLNDENIFFCGPILYELMQGIKSDNEKSIIKDTFQSLEYIEMTKDLWLKSAELSSQIRKEGKTIPFSDIIIATIAKTFDLSILTIDKHFNDIPNILIYNSQLTINNS